MCVLLAQSCPTLFDPMDCSLPGFSVMEFSRQEYWGGLPFPSPEDLPNPGIELRSPALQADSLQSGPPGKPPAYEYLIDPAAFIEKTFPFSPLNFSAIFVVNQGTTFMCFFF